MNSTDKKLYELFATSYFIDLGYWEGKELPRHVRLPEPQLHDVFRVAKEKGIMFVDEKGIVFRKYPGGTSNISIPYNPTLPLLQQSEETKLAIISLFS